MKKDNIDDLFNHLNSGWDTEEPSQGHELRFLEKLNTSKDVKSLPPKKGNTIKFLFIAASFLLIFGLGFLFINQNHSINEQVVKISPEISNTEFYFANVIEQEIKKLQNENSPETKKIVDDTMIQLSKLEKNYKSIERDLINGGNSKLILSAMIVNFQTRIDLLEDVLQQIEVIKNIKKNEHENTII
ncbi:hypothetical protein I2486_14140 [Cellulophaga sp. E16_2]|uniref:Anti-sigma factor n=1 Tax=Cellulophaga algicola (strain DSM 14237 / IC166 / ACAM 630) TaxID=688270 RepID=E6XDL6_CELAD|nr:MULTISPECIES: hypothetical protein [Cellulophaga]ADV50158.1 hypothetical protein Celal_2880 [Cellulophaga algicola DSM 14237]MBO0592543.1 hypothetical protein [Cellulophaga sp. E16_2]